MKFNFYKNEIRRTNSIARVLGFVIAFSFILAPLQNVFAERMTSGNYTLQSDAVDFGGGRSTSGSYALEAAAGEIATGDSSSSNKKVHAGFEQTDPVAQQSTTTSTQPTSTASSGSIPTPVNVINFKATPFTKSIGLSWTYPEGADIVAVRIVKSDKFFPNDISDGEVIFEGNGNSIVDNDVKPGTRYYYALFARNAHGDYSSGVLAQARIPLTNDTTPPVKPGDIFENIPPSPNLDATISALSLLDFDFIQGGRKLTSVAGTIPVDGKQNLTIQLAYHKVPEILKTIAITLTDPQDSTKVFTFLLRVNKDKTAYEATIAPLGRSGDYKLDAIILDYKNQGLKRLNGNLHSLILADAQSILGDGDTSMLTLMIVLLVLAFIAVIIFIFLERRKKQREALAKKVLWGILLFLVTVTNTVIYIPALTSTAHAAINKQINYQGKLANSSDDIVADGTYAMEFNLYTVSSGGSPIWTESLTGGNKVQVTNGLFSVLLGQVSSLAAVDFNQTLYLGVNIEGDGEMTPRKKIGAVPAAFVADTLDGLDSTQFLRSDATNASGIFTDITITNATITNASTTDITVAGKFYDSTGAAGNNGQVLKISGGVPVWGTDLSGSGGGSEINWTYFNGSGTYVSTTTNQVLIGDVATTSNQKLEVIGGTYISGNLGLGTTSPYAKLSVNGKGVFNQDVRANYYTATSTSVASTFPYASSTAITVSGTASTSNLIVSGNATLAAASIGTLNGLLYGTNGAVGTVATSTLNIALSDTTGTLPVNRGGTGLTSYTLGDVLYANGTGSLAGTSTANLKTTLGLSNVENTALSTWAGSTNLTALGTIVTGVWNGTAIGDAFLTKTGNWTGTFDGQEGTYYLDARNLTNFGTPFYNFFSATTTDALAQGSTNKYYSDTLVNAYIHASSTIPKTYTANTFNALQTFGNNISLGGAQLSVGALSYGNLLSYNGTNWVNTSTSSLNIALSDTTGTLPVSKGGTGQTSFGQGWLHSDGTTLTSSTSPTVAYITATSTTATSTFAGNISVAGRVGVGSISSLYQHATGGLISSPYLRTDNTFVIGTTTTGGNSRLVVGNPDIVNPRYWDFNSNTGVTYNDDDGRTPFSITADGSLETGVNILGSVSSRFSTNSTGIGFFGATPVAKPSSTTDLRQALINLGLYTTGGATPLNLNGGALTAGSASIGTLSGLLYGTNGSVGTIATSSLGLATFGYLFPSNATSTLLAFNGGITSYASTTIGAGGQATGLTINGGATTTGNAYFAGNIGVGTTTPWRTLSVNGSSDLGNNALAGYFTATTSTASTFPYASTTMVSATTASTTNLIVSSLGGTTQCLQANSAGVISGTGSSCSGTSASYDWVQQSNIYSINSLTPSTTIPLWIKSTATSTFAGGIESWDKIGAPYFIATSTTATSTFAGDVVLGNLRVAGKYPSRAASIELQTDPDFNQRAFITSYGDTGSSEGTISFATGNNPIFEINSGDNNSLNLISDSRIRFSVSTPTGNVDALDIVEPTGYVGIGTSSPYARLSVAGQTVAAYFTATTSTASTFPYASTTMVSATTASTTNLIISGVPNCSSSSALTTNSAGVVACGAILGSGGGSYPFSLAGNATSTLTQFNGGLTSYASTTIGAGTQATGLTINGGATTTGNAYFAGKIGVGTTTPFATLSVVGATSDSTAFAVYGSSQSSIGGGVLLQAGNGDTTGGAIEAYAGNKTSVDANGGNIKLRAGFGGVNGVSGKVYIDGGSMNAFGGSTSGGDILLSTVNTGNVGIGTTSPYAKLSVVGQVVGAYFTATTSTASRFPYASTTAITATTASTTNLIVSSLGGTTQCLQANSAGVISGTGSACSGTSASYDWVQQSNIYSINSLTPSTTIPLWIKSTATSTFAGGIESWDKIGAPYFVATSTSIASTFRYASTTALTVSGVNGLTVGTLNGVLYGTNGAVGTVATSTLNIALSDTTGILAINRGGTGTSTAPTYGKVLLGNALGTYDLVATSSLGLGSGFGSVTSVDASGGTTGLSFTGGPVTTSGTLTLAGILNVANGGTGWANINSGYIPFGNGASALGTSSSFFWDNTNARLGIGTTSPYAKLSVAGNVVAANFIATSTTATSTFAGSVNIGNGALSYDSSTGTTSISYLEAGNMSFAADSGVISWIDMPVTSASANGVVNSYSAGFNGSSLLTIYGVSNGSGSVINQAVGIGTTSPNWKLSVNGSGSFDGFARASYFTATSSTASTFPYASTTMLSATTASTTNLIISGLTSSGLGVDSIGRVYAAATTTFSSGLTYSNGNVTNTGLLSLQQLGGGSAQTGAITFATSSQTTNGQTIGLNITNSSGAFTFNPTLSGTLTAAGGGTGLSSVSAAGVLLGNYAGTGWQQLSTSSLGLATFSYLFPSNATSTLLAFNGGLTSYASTTIGNGTQTGGLTVSGNSTTTGNILVQGTTGTSTFAGGVLLSTTAGDVGIGTTSPKYKLDVDGQASFFSTLGSSQLTARFGEAGKIILDGKSTAIDSDVFIHILPEDGEAMMMSNYFDNTNRIINRSFVNSSDGSKLEMTMSGAVTSEMSFAIAGDETGGFANFYDARPTPRGIEYSGDYSAGFSSRSLVDKAYVDSVASSSQWANVSAGINYGSGNVGIGTSSPYAKLSVVGQVVGAYFTATTSTASTFPYASSTAITVSGTASTTNLIVSNTASIGSLNGPLQANNGVVSATTSIGVLYGGTGLTSAPSYGNILVGNASGGYTLTATSSLGLPTFSYLFPSNATSTLLAFNGGLTSYASTTIGAGTQATGLTINGGATTTGNAYFAGNIGVGTTTPWRTLSVNGSSDLGINALAGYFTATTSTASTFPYASTTMVSATTASTTNLIISGVPNCSSSSALTTNSSGVVACGAISGGAVFAFTPGTNYGVAVNSTSTPIWFQNGLMSSTTSYIAYASTTMLSATTASTTNLIVSGINGTTQCLQASASGVISGTGSACGAGGGSAFPFTPGTNYGTAVNSTTTPIWFQNGLMASTTAYLTYATTTALTVTGNAYFPGNGIWNSSGFLGIGTTSPYAALSVVGASGVVADKYFATSTTATSTFAGGLDVGAGSLMYDLSTGITSAASFQTGNLNFDTDAGLVSWADLLLSSASSGTIEGYTASLNGSSTIAIYGVSAGSGWLQPDFPRVAIGTTTAPSSKLHVFSNGTGTGGTFELTNNASTSLVKVLDNGSFGIGTTSPFATLAVNPVAGVASNQFVVGSSTATNFIIKNNGAVGIGSTTPWRTLDVNGTVALNGLSAGAGGEYAVCINNTTKEISNAGAASCVVSSARFKDNITALDSGLDEVMKLKPSTFTLKNQPNTGSMTDTHLGLIAEDVDLVDKRLVQYEADGITPRTVRYEELTALLAKAIQEQQVEIVGIASTTKELSTVSNSNTSNFDIFSSNVNSSVAILSSNLASTSQTTKTLAAALDSTNATVSGLADSISGVTDSITSMNASTSALTLRISSLEDQMSALASSTDVLVKALASSTADLIASSTAQTLASSTSFIASVFESIKELLATTVTKIKGVFVGELHVEEKLCVEDVCINKDQLKALLINAGGTSSTTPSINVPAQNNQNTQPTPPTPAPDVIITPETAPATSTPQVVTPPPSEPSNPTPAPAPESSTPAVSPEVAPTPTPTPTPESQPAPAPAPEPAPAPVADPAPAPAPTE